VAGTTRTLLTYIRWTPAALDDLKAISDYVEQQRSLSAANKVCRVIYDAIQTLRRFPESGMPGIEEATRELVVPKQPTYIVVYRLLSSEALQILRIWHGAQQRDD
jgi:addiction module RelE/StbE family toxin